MSHVGSKSLKATGLWIGLPLVPVTFLEVLRRLNGAPFLEGAAVRWGVVVGVLLAAQAGALWRADRWHWLWPWRGVAILGAVSAVALGYAWDQGTGLAWLTLVGLYVLLLITAEGTWGLTTLVRHYRLRFLYRVAVFGAASAVGSLTSTAIGQIESRFSDEEFFVLLQALALALFSGLMLAIHLLLSPPHRTIRDATSWPGLRLDARWVLIGLTILVVTGGWVTVLAYQASFYPLEAPTFEGISPEEPFLCGEIASLQGEQPDGVEVFRRLLERVEANPRKRPPEYGMLALGTGERRWAEAFRESLLSEAAEGRFAGPANSVKSIQHDAALRLYYLWKVQEAFPDLFAETDDVLLRNWFTALNTRALTVEWVDWTYALAFTKWPEGPYENQETGAGLLALLEVSGYAAPELSVTNGGYLARNERGWQARFRNTDDAFVYQPEWITNALFQSLYTGRISKHNRQFSFEWLLLQSLPDGAVLRYNHPARAPLVGVAYLGASLLNDPRLLWLANRSLTQVETENGYLYAQPGLEEPVTFAGQPPTAASCLFYGDSGLPNQVGPLAPDKIVFRDGWSPDSAYTMLNLRFTGWHRYKATNTLTLLYQGGPLVVEHTVGQPFAWLPAGRSLFRDKRIPRENLNGLLIKRSGMSAVLYQLTGIGGPWAQDPPYYAEVVAFETGDKLDWSHTRLASWRSWQHDRWVYSYHRGGPIVVLDRVEGPATGQAALVWHLAGKVSEENQRVRLRDGDHPVEMLFVPVPTDGIPSEVAEQSYEVSNLRVSYSIPAGSRVGVVTLFLLERWLGAEVSWKRTVEGMTLEIGRGKERIILPLAGILEGGQ